MQTVILCGGKGTRIRDVAPDLPKPLVPIGDRPILWHIMKGFALYGHRDFVLCLGHKSWAIKKYFLEYFLANSNFTIDLRRPTRYELHGDDGIEDWRVTLVETGEDAMTGCRVKRIEQFVEGEEFFLTYGDGVSDVDLDRLLASHRQHGRTATVTAVTPPSRFGEMDLSGDRVVSFAEKPAMIPGRINGGFFVLNRRVFRQMQDDPSLVFERDTLPTLASDDQLRAYRHDGFWHPMDSSRDFNYLNELWQTGSAPWMTWKAARRMAA